MRRKRLQLTAQKYFLFTRCHKPWNFARRSANRRVVIDGRMEELRPFRSDEDFADVKGRPCETRLGWLLPEDTIS